MYLHSDEDRIDSDDDDDDDDDDGDYHNHHTIMVPMTTSL
jgi:hypothetical protein